MNDPLDLPLRDIHLPDGLSLWPLAYGWWILIAVIIMTAIIAIILYRRNQKARISAITLARKEFARITDEYQKNNETLKLVKEISILLRRLSISLFPRTEVASLTGEEWLAYLDRYVPGAPFTEGQGRMLVDAPYRQNVDTEELETLIHQCHNWIEAVSRTRSKPA
ncbi:MAG: hypothetical protein ACI9XC_002042 [Gammaproteobacteria bacterium]|jgi:hypothetical protein